MKFYTENQEESMLVSKKLFRDLLDMAVFRSKEIEESKSRGKRRR